MRYLTPVLFAAAASILSSAPTYADLGDQLFKLLPDDGAAEDDFGVSVAISGAIVIVGANYHDDNGSASGSAYLFDTTTGEQVAKLLADDGEWNDRFGISVAISGATAIVGAYLDGGNDTGSAYLFDTTTGEQIAKLLPKDGAATDDYFGLSVAISGGTAIVGVIADDDNGFNSGSAYLFDTTTGEQIAKLLANDGVAFDNFGSSVAIFGVTAIVGAWRDNGNKSGSAYLFDISDRAYPTQIAKLVPNDGEAGDEFGYSVAISGTTAIVGAWRDDNNGIDSGSAYLFDIATGQQIAKLMPEDGAVGHRFGISVAISGAPGNETAIVGAWWDDDNGDDSGSAYFFDTTTGRQIAKLLAKDGAANDWFGISVAISETTAIVGAYFDDDNGSESGSAYIFDAADTPPCPADLNGDGSVGVSDLLILLGFWGPCEKVCLGDFDDSGDVGVKDLLVLLGNWGPCP